MEINVYEQNGIARQVNNCAEDLEQFQDKLLTLSENIEAYWQGEEVDAIRIVIQSLLDSVQYLACNARDISQDIYANIDEIKKEERARCEEQLFGSDK